MCIFGRPQVIISGSDAFKETEVRKWNQPRQSGVGRTFIRRTPGEKFEETSRTCSKLKKCSNSNVKSLRDICQVSLRKLRISSEAGRKIIFKFDPGPGSSLARVTGQLKHLCALLFANPLFCPQRVFGRWIKLWWLDLREMSLISTLLYCGFLFHFLQFQEDLKEFCKFIKGNNPWYSEYILNLESVLIERSYFDCVTPLHQLTKILPDVSIQFSGKWNCLK